MQDESTREHLTEESFDPENWDEFRNLAHQMVDDMIDHLQDLPNQPPWQPVPPTSKEALEEPLPVNPQGCESVYQEFLEHILPYTNGNRHARFLGWVQGTGTPLGMMADMLASGINPHMAGFQQAPTIVEHQVIAWLAEIVSMPRDSSGVFVSGGTVANLIALAVARHVKAEYDVRSAGVGASESPMTIYCSTETHGWIHRAVEVLGIGTANLRMVPTNDQYQLDLNKLKMAIDQDRQSGRRPICVCANAGTVNTGAVDDLTAIADFCQQQNLWFHVDGALGALAVLTTEKSRIFRGIDRADSLALDLHKWGYLPYEAGCVLVSDATAHQDTFSISANYLHTTNRGVTAGGLPFAERSLELTRGFKALKAWFSFKAYGVSKLAALIQQNIDQAQYLGQLIEQHPQLQLLTPITLNVICFRFLTQDDRLDINAVNRELLLRMQESGTFVISSTVLDDCFALRAAITNHRLKTADIEFLIDEVVQQGQRIVLEWAERPKI